jgi:hypothetical protein
MNRRSSSHVVSCRITSDLNAQLEKIRYTLDTQVICEYTVSVTSQQSAYLYALSAILEKMLSTEFGPARKTAETTTWIITDAQKIYLLFQSANHLVKLYATHLDLCTFPELEKTARYNETLAAVALTLQFAMTGAAFHEIYMFVTASYSRLRFLLEKSRQLAHNEDLQLPNRNLQTISALSLYA